MRARLGAGLLVVVMALGAAACGGGGGTGEGEPDGSMTADSGGGDAQPDGNAPPDGGDGGGDGSATDDGGDDDGSVNDGGGDDGEAGPVRPGCGDGDLDDGEECDDSNNASGDGCSRLCELEEGATCPVEGALCEICGNGIRESTTEACDDGNRTSGDGCSADCQTVEAGFVCLVPGSACDRCGDGIKSSRESCDDGSECVGGDNAGVSCTEDPEVCTGGGTCEAVSGDGCSDDCQLIEPGFQCPRSGGICHECGDGEVSRIYCVGGDAAGEGCSVDADCPGGFCGPEQCDDGNASGADGCSARCRIEGNYSCPTPGSACLFCGDGVVQEGSAGEPGEQCDDGNFSGRTCDGGDSDGETCFADGDCPGGFCGQGDGCTTRCELEDGFDCPIEGERCVYCGNGIVETAGDHLICMGGSADGADCTDDPTACVDGGGDCVTERACVGGSADGANCTGDASACVDGGGVCRVVAEFREVCDDGNTADGDGCAADCSAIETGWVCPDGLPCNRCGDGIQQETEICDDGRQCDDGSPCDDDADCGGDQGSCAPRDGDGCSADCKTRAPNFTCEPGQPCVECGDGVRDQGFCEGGGQDGSACTTDSECPGGFCGPERCDDGSRCVVAASGAVTATDCTDDPGVCSVGERCQPVGGDGCSAKCTRIEAGWSCEESGGISQCTYCGDGVVEGDEACDDGNTRGGDGCSADCRAVEDFYNCFDAGQPCVRCGNGVVQSDEACDDGSECDDGTPCTSDAQCGGEPGSCAPRDGNGCAADCRSVETGWTCRVPGLECSNCGDGIRQETEACDEGAARDDVGCVDACTRVQTHYRCEVPGEACTRCGDGVRDVITDSGGTVLYAEVCDDGNNVAGDGCAANCASVTTGFVCTQTDTGLSACTRCGNGVVEDVRNSDSSVAYAEVCDDGNALNGDGCSADCRSVEEGYNCYTEGARCVQCGNGSLQPGESCDDGNNVSGDGCAADCNLEERGCVGGSESGTDCSLDDSACVSGGGTCVAWQCETAGVECRLCGDGVRQAGEACDDGDLEDGDGCSSTCTVETSGAWSCPVAGADCIECGDGVRQLMCIGGANAGAACSESGDCDSGNCGPEACDDGNTSGGDGCSANCRQVQAGWQCDVTPGQLSVCTDCGNGVIDRRCIGGTNEGADCSADDGICTGGGVCAPEVCDDGNALSGDGCSDLCTVVDPGYNCFDEGRRCVECGNGIRESDEECDDGNAVDGDGCSSSCVIESVCVGGDADGSDCTDDAGACTGGGLCTAWDCPFANVECGLCGDGDVQDVEVCDEGVNADNVGCSNDCGQIDSGYTCAVGGETCVQCGNGQIDAVMDGGSVVYQEECDDADGMSGDGCSARCKLEAGWTCEEDSSGTTQCALCGNLNVEVLAGTSIEETCDDGNQLDGDGCSATCEVESEYNCPSGGGSCQRCGNGIKESLEACDDGNSADGDGCIDNCTAIDSAGGWACPVAGSACNNCGDGVLQGAEACDDGDSAGGDGCSADCFDIETNWVCPVEGQACIQCGNGVVESVGGYAEECDDGNNVTGDGCNRLCFLEGNGFDCAEDATPRTYCVKCGNGDVEEVPQLPALSEACDDSNTASGDGCAADCSAIEDNYNCPLEGFGCFLCGDGVKDPGEACDEGEVPADGVGCIDRCKSIDTDYLCQADAECELCGDGIVDSRESCDDGNRSSGDGCDAFCQEEDGYDCSVDDTCVAAECGDGFVAGNEECDDGNDDSGDGCSVLCQTEDGYVCVEGATPACRETSCGDGIVEGSEQCDDGNTSSGDGCTGTESADQTAHCQLEAGFKCPDAGEACRITVCGDGFVEGLEECDPQVDGSDLCDDTSCTLQPLSACTVSVNACNGGDNDGLSCSTESDCPNTGTCASGGADCSSAADCGGGTCNVSDYGDCSPMGDTCTATTCGDGVVEGNEACDDGGDTGGYCYGGSNAGDVCATDADCGTGSCLDGCDSSCEVDALFRCETDEATGGSDCKPIWQFVPIRTFNITNINPSALYFDPDTRSFVGFKNQTSQQPIELCLDGTIFCDTGSCSVSGASCTTDADCTGGGVCESNTAECRAPADRVRPMTAGNAQMGAATYNPFGPSWLILEEGGELIEVPRGSHCIDGVADSDPNDTQCFVNANCTTGYCERWMDTVDADTAGNGAGSDFVETLNANLCDSGANFGMSCGGGCGGGGAKCGITTNIVGMAVGEDGRLFVSDSNELIWVFAPDSDQAPGTNNVSFDTSQAVEVIDSGNVELLGLWMVPGEGLIGAYAGVSGQSDRQAKFWDDGFLSVEGQSTIPGPLFPDQTVSVGDAADGVETATDGGSFILCPSSNGSPCQLFGRGCETDLDCASVVPGTVCSTLMQCAGGTTPGANCELDTDCGGGGTCGDVTRCQGGTDAGNTCTSDVECGGGGVCGAVRYCNLPGRARDDRTTINTTDTDVDIDVLDNDVRSESSCISPEFYIDSVDATGSQGGSIVAADSDGDGKADVVTYNPPADFCGAEETFDYTAALGGGELDSATVTVFVACVCGDGIVQAGEQCDDGLHCVGGDNEGASCTSDPGLCDAGGGSCEQVNDDNCTNACLINVVCGDGEIGPGEECDDANTASNDGCSGSCLLESVCGNGEVEGVEECDDGNEISGDGCQDNCRLPSCGDGVTDLALSLCLGGTDDGTVCSADGDCDSNVCEDVSEECDDGAANSDTTVDACRSDCTLPTCGDDVVDTGEECDDASDPNCVGCREQICGNGEVEGAEQCDPPDGTTCGSDCRDLPVCGNGVVEGSEECDDGNDTAGDGCRPDCTIELCGDGITDDPGEECDYNDPAYNGDPSSPPYLVCTTQCEVLPVCGNGEPEEGEECDEGLANANTADATCRTDCTIGGCGDGVLDTDEQCDDGNLTSGDGCDDQCLSEQACPNGVVEGTEECDDGNTDGGDGCRADCTLEECGDAILDPQEECDYGDPSLNLEEGQICTFSCTVQPVCGNGVPENGEGCDEGAGNLETPNASCRTDCTPDACGDGVVDDAPAGRPAEECDDGNNVDGDGCDASCAIEPEVCGDGIVNGLEECDDGGVCSGTPTSCTSDAACDSGTCEPQGGDGCRADCTEEVCGDGILDEATEECDYAADLPDGQVCTFSCTIQPVCGNGLQEPGEACDLGAQNSEDPNASCRTDCTVAACGDGITDDGAPRNETCDDGNNLSGDGCTASCQVEPDECGDGDITGSESCDDGNAVSGDGCRGTEAEVPAELQCQPEECGDGYVDTLRAETCDDGNRVSGDGCSAACLIETVCGDGVPQGAEECDDGGYSGACDYCSPTCQDLGAVCGNGVVEAGEECDDGPSGNDASVCAAPSGGDGCDANCQLENVCGDGELGGLEECDEGGSNSDAPDATCRTDCTEAGCGDGIVDSGEECDDGNDVPDDRCSNACVDLRTCGDGIRDADLGEECDDGNNVSGDGCSSACIDENPECGDGIKHATEQCDDGNDVSGDGCSSTCQREGDFCGDGIVGAGEECDNGGECVGGGNDGAACTGNDDCDSGECRHVPDDGCRLDCTAPYCGDGILDPGEDCEPDGSCSCTDTCETGLC